MMRKRSGLPAVKKISEMPLVSVCDKTTPALLHQISAPASDSKVDSVEVTQKLPVRDMSVSPQSFVDAEEPLLVDVMERALRVAKMKAGTAALALRAEQEKIRLEALEVVTLRQKIAAAELAGEAAKARIEQNRIARLAEEAEAQKHEDECLAHEQSAILAAKQRIELAKLAKFEAEQRLMLEVELAKLEQQSLEQERELKICAKNRIVALEQAALVMQKSIQSELQATQLVEAGIATKQCSLSIPQENVPCLVSSRQLETQADSLVYASQQSDDDELKSDAAQHQIYVGNESDELLVTRANFRAPVANSLQYSPPLVGPGQVLLVEQDGHRMTDFSVTAQESNATLVDDEYRNFEQAFAVNGAGTPDQTMPKRRHPQLKLTKFVHSAGLNGLLRMIGWSSSILVFAYFMLAFFHPDAGFSLGKPVVAVTKYEPPEIKVSHSSVVQVLPYNSDSYIPFADLKMTDHLQFSPE
jgi:hypothetical protein